MPMQFFTHKKVGAIRVCGEDSLPYLQSQMTIDLRKLKPLTTRYGLRLSLKGKVLFGVQIIRVNEEEFWMICRDTPTTTILNYLEENIVADEVEFSEVPGQWMLSTLLTDSSTHLDNQVGNLSLPAQGEALEMENGWIYVDSRMPNFAYTFLHPTNMSPPHFEEAEEICKFEMEERRLREQLFRPGWEIAEDAFPQEGGLEKDAVDFDKGCYLGQEVMARIHSMGNVRKKTVVVRGTSNPSSVLPVSLLFMGKELGSVKSQFLHPEEKYWIGAALVHEKAMEDMKTEGLEEMDSGNRVFLHFDE